MDTQTPARQHQHTPNVWGEGLAGLCSSHPCYVPARRGWALITVPTGQAPAWERLPAGVSSPPHLGSDTRKPQDGDALALRQTPARSHARRRGWGPTGAEVSGRERARGHFQGPSLLRPWGTAWCDGGVRQAATQPGMPLSTGTPTALTPHGPAGSRDCTAAGDAACARSGVRDPSQLSTAAVCQCQPLRAGTRTPPPQGRFCLLVSQPGPFSQREHGQGITRNPKSGVALDGQ